MFKNRVVATPLCPRCANDTVHVECLEPSISDTQTDICRCRCRKCGARFEALTPRDAWFGLNDDDVIDHIHPRQARTVAES